MKNCFIVCPIGTEGSETRSRSDKLFKHVISPVCKECDFTPIRIDMENTNGSITEEIITHICNDDLVIADLTDLNPNAFYEVGYRAALKKPSIHLTSKDTSIPFDVASIRTFSYDLSDLDSVEEIKSRLVQTINTITFDSGDLILQSENDSANNMINAQILQEIFKIQDSIATLTASINAKDSSAVSVLADKLATTSTKTTDTVLMETLLPKLLDNPEQFLKLVEMTSKLPSRK
jgi:nucleoside 2-deoxyribosyltransferase